MLYVNGLPLVVIELKDPANTAADLNVAIDQFGRYKETAPDLFVPNLLLVASDGLLTRVGSITSGRQRFTPWRPASGGEPTLEALIRELLEPRGAAGLPAVVRGVRGGRAGEHRQEGGGVSPVPGGAQGAGSVIGAMKTPDRKGDEAAARAAWSGTRRAAGKSLTMLMLAGTLVRAAEMANPTVVIVTDRNDLDDQLFDTFAMGRATAAAGPRAGRQPRASEEPARPGERRRGVHDDPQVHRGARQISERANIVVMADEAHRSQYGFVDGGARWMREALPNATFVGFTGTPLTAGDRVTRHVFGDYADVYDIRQAVADGATVPIYYEPRIVKLTIDENGAAEAEKKIAEYATRDEDGQETPENIRIPVEELYGAPERLERVAKFIVEHWEAAASRDGRQGDARDDEPRHRRAALRPDREAAPGWASDDDAKGAMKVIMTGGPDDPGASHATCGPSAAKALADRFKDPADDFRLAIVVDMWLTGFDVPAAHTMYLDKPLAGHNLMQAIARVNRVYGEKPGGLIVDLIGLADPLADALATYANATGETDKPVKELQDEAIPAMRSAFEQLRDFFHGFDYAAALDADPANVLRVYLGAIDHVLDVKHTVGEETGRKRFGEMVKRLATAFALAVPREETREIAPHLAFFQRVAAMIRKRLADDAGPRQDTGGSGDIDAAVRQVIGGAVNAGEVIDLFAAAGLDAARLDILSDEFLQRVSALEQRNLALETLRKLLNDQIKISERTNLVQAQKFREALEKAMLGHTNKQITTAQMIAQLLELAKWVREAKRHGEELGLSNEETAFYDALAENGSAKEVMRSDQLRLMARELAEMVKKMPKLDWTQRESVRADLRRNVRRLLAKFGYPPDLSEDATQLVLKQAELSTTNGGE